jgi:EF hand
MPSPRRPLIGCVLAVSAGCSSKIESIPPPSYDAAAIVQAALAQMDKNKNGQIDGSELDACPALKRALAAIDKNGDKAISAAELQQRVELYARQGLISLSCTVTLDGRPLDGATVTFEPEPFMGPALKPATAVTDKDGVVGTFQVDGKSATSIPAGLYRIKVTKEGTTIPPRFNTDTTLGREVVNEPRQGGATIELALSSR